jgi:crotonobetainyl-CoA:carnitine CoA-transferase CaiB-like acyl-CoA transferase
MGPLHGIRIVELAGIGPSPMACMLLADLGADVVRIDRIDAVELGVKRPARYNLLSRNRRLVALDLKQPAAARQVLDLVEHADVLIEGFRPGVTERLGLGPEACMARNPRLVYGRMTGWGQTGPLAQAAGHDLNYVALTGIIHAIGRRDQAPAIPLALTGDMGGGALYLAMGVLAALLEARTSGQGQVVDAAIVDGAASLATTFYGLHGAGLWSDQRGSNILDSGAPFYDVYECQDGLWISVGPIEARFYAALLDKLELDTTALGAQSDRDAWPQAKVAIAQRFKTRTRAQWCELLEGTDVCFAPVLTFGEAPEHPHLKARSTFIDIDGVVQPAPAPRFSRSVPDQPKPPCEAPDTDIEELLADWRHSSPRPSVSICEENLGHAQ